MNKKYNWDDIQKYYDAGGTWKSINEKFGASMATISKAVNRGDLKTRNISEALKISPNNKNRKLSDETKKKISESRKKYLFENPDKVPYLLNHHSNGESYPEKYFSEILKDIEFTKYYRIGLYHIDIAIMDKRIAIEIDGEQHYVDKRIVESDIRKDEYLSSNGWDIIRIRWAKYQKFNTNEKEEYVNSLVDYINNKASKPFIFDKENKCVCGKIIRKQSKLCISCNNKGKEVYYENRNGYKKPTYEQLLKDIKETNYSKTSKKYNVSPTTIKKWIKKYDTQNL